MTLTRKHLPLVAAAIQTAQYSLAGYFLIGAMGWFFVGSMGGLVSLAMAYGASQVADVAKGRKLQSWVALFAMAIFSPVLVGSATFHHLDIIANPYWRGVVSGVWGILPDAAVILSGFAAGRGLFHEEKKKSVASPKGKKRSAKKSAKYPRTCTHCDAQIKSPNAVGAHMKKHHPELCKPKTLAEALFEKEIKP